MIEQVAWKSRRFLLYFDNRPIGSGWDSVDILSWTRRGQLWSTASMSLGSLKVRASWRNVSEDKFEAVKVATGNGSWLKQYPRWQYFRWKACFTSCTGSGVPVWRNPCNLSAISGSSLVERDTMLAWRALNSPPSLATIRWTFSFLRKSWKILWKCLQTRGSSGYSISSPRGSFSNISSRISLGKFRIFIFRVLIFTDSICKLNSGCCHTIDIPRKNSDVSQKFG